MVFIVLKKSINLKIWWILWKSTKTASNNNTCLNFNIDNSVSWRDSVTNFVEKNGSKYTAKHIDTSLRYLTSSLGQKLNLSINNKNVCPLEKCWNTIFHCIISPNCTVSQYIIVGERAGLEVVRSRDQIYPITNGLYPIDNVAIIWPSQL